MNISLDNSIRSKIEAAINSFSAIDPNYGRAIYYQQVQIMNTQSLINDLKSTLETDLKTLTVPKNGTVTIAWEWPYEVNVAGNDAQDTAIADLVDDGVDLRLVVKLAYQAVQVD